MGGDFWTDDRVEWLKAAWPTGASASRLAKEAGTTRNTILGKVHRLGLAREGSTRDRVVRFTPAAPAAPKPPKPPKTRERTEPPADPALMVTIDTIGDRQCHWPIGDPQSPEFRYCGRKSKAGSAYCEGHAGFGHQPKGARK